MIVKFPNTFVTHYELILSVIVNVSFQFTPDLHVQIESEILRSVCNDIAHVIWNYEVLVPCVSFGQNITVFSSSPRSISRSRNAATGTLLDWNVKQINLSPSRNRLPRVLRLSTPLQDPFPSTQPSVLRLSVRWITRISEQEILFTNTRPYARRGAKEN
jgi:hypothetical protein